jgi:DNA-binding transcriptional LysR family regulator
MSKDLNDTLMFAKIVEKGSFTAAARALGVPKATLSRKVQELEERLGTRLLKRTTRSLGLTEAGTIYYEHSARIARELDEAESAVSQLNGAPRGWLRITAPYSLGTDVIAPIIPEFMARYPDVRVEMLLSNDVIDLVATDLDLALRVGKLQDSTLAARRLSTMETHVYASHEYIEKHGEPLVPADLEHHRALAWPKQRRGNRFYWPLHGESGEVEAPVSPVFIANDPDSMLQTLLAGLGVAIMPERITHLAVAAGCLRRVLAAWSGPTVELNAVLPPGRAHSPKVRAFVDFLVQHLDLRRLSQPRSGNCD